MINSDKEVFSAKYLVEKLDVPDKYLRRLMTDMSKQGFILSLKGRDGGYIFAKNPNSIFLSDIVDAVEGMNNYTGCIMGHEQCSSENPCSLHKSYGPIRDQLLNFMNSTSIAELENHDIIKY
ncbi:MAG: hypothetical protein DRI86_02155 [Bacteroidetes bacterium]|nr:MAG: hypothetical protein DRI86_02155 [Bacteroidota bacterium]